MSRLQFLPAVVVGASVGGFMLGAPWCLNRYVKHHERAFNALVHEAQRPRKSRNIDHVEQLQTYLGNGFVHQTYYPPPCDTWKQQ